MHVQHVTSQVTQQIVYRIFRSFCSFYVTSCFVYVTQKNAEGGSVNINTQAAKSRSSGAAQRVPIRHQVGQKR